MSSTAAQRTAIAVRHVPFEDLGNLEPALHARGYRVEYREAGVDALEIAASTDLVVVLGGPIGAYEEEQYPFLAGEIRMVERRLAADLPTLGICLGAQVMARAAGAKVYAGPRKEIGWATVSLASAAAQSPLRHLDGVRVLHWHGDTFDLPADAVRLASTQGYPNQAFSMARRALALQFHAEVREPGLERWYIGHAGEINATAGISARGLRSEGQRHAPFLQAPAARLWEEWLSTLD